MTARMTSSPFSRLRVTNGSTRAVHDGLLGCISSCLYVYWDTDFSFIGPCRRSGALHCHPAASSHLREGTSSSFLRNERAVGIQQTRRHLVTSLLSASPASPASRADRRLRSNGPEPSLRFSIHSRYDHGRLLPPPRDTSALRRPLGVRFAGECLSCGSSQLWCIPGHYVWERLFIPRCPLRCSPVRLPLILAVLVLTARTLGLEICGSLLRRLLSKSRVSTKLWSTAPHALSRRHRHRPACPSASRSPTHLLLGYRRSPTYPRTVSWCDRSA